MRSSWAIQINNQRIRRISRLRTGSGASRACVRAKKPPLPKLRSGRTSISQVAILNYQNAVSNYSKWCIVERLEAPPLSSLYSFQHIHANESSSCQILVQPVLVNVPTVEHSRIIHAWIHRVGCTYGFHRASPGIESGPSADCGVLLR